MMTGKRWRRAARLAELWDDPEEDTRLQRYVASLYTTSLELPTAELGPGERAHAGSRAGRGCWHALASYQVARTRLLLLDK
jgi:hypothetical protein